ncbi:hypothetical protein GIB67_038418 [Kingdonia uniflora]|uniref:Uncharacterized protein n=1 Tax=Kingdonia uniflora TaxID=39325 RepID=A0A7J7NP05_9MAGN|nr:hypothetical protein GIB67_038418 [Kingdonia uniflora]
MAGVEEGKRQVSSKEARNNFSKTPETGRSAQPNPVKPSKIVLKYLKKWTLKALQTSGTTGSSEVAKDMRRRVKPSGESGEKVTEGQSAAGTTLKRSKKGPGWQFSMEKKIRERWTDALKEVRQLKASHAVAIGQLQVETKANLEEMVEERDRLGHHLMLKDYSEEEVDAIKADTYVEEEDEEEAKAVGIVNGLDGASRQTVLNNQGDDVELLEGGSEKAVREMSLRIKNLESGLTRERETSEALLYTQAKLQVELDSSRSREDDALMRNQEFAELFDRMKETNENREDQYVKAHFRLVELTEAISELTLHVEEKDVEIKIGLKELAEGDVQKGNANLREYQHKLDVVLIREKVLEGEIKTKKLLVKRKKELLKYTLAREELNTKIRRFCAWVVDLEAMNLAESAKYIKKLEENVIYHPKVDAEMTGQKNEYARLESRLEKVRTRFATMVIPDTSQSDLLKAIVAYFIEEVKRLES